MKRPLQTALIIAVFLLSGLVSINGAHGANGAQRVVCSVAGGGWAPCHVSIRGTCRLRSTADGGLALTLTLRRVPSVNAQPYSGNAVINVIRDGFSDGQGTPTLRQMGPHTWVDTASLGSPLRRVKIYVLYSSGRQVNIYDRCRKP